MSWPINIRYSIYSCVLLYWCVSVDGEEGDAGEKSEKPERYPILIFAWDEVRVPITVVVWVFIAAIAKILFHLHKKIPEMFPDCSLLILVGLMIGVALVDLNVDRSKFYLTSEVFFLYLLPPLVFDAGYNMPVRSFFDHFGTCIIFALIGTAFNIIAIGLSLWAISRTGLFPVEMGLLDLLLFSSLIADVDPVAVIVIFEEMNVNELLFISVFGESLLNDGISVVMYRMLLTFVQIGPDNLIARDFAFGGISFFVIAIGGVGIGILFAAIGGFLSKYTENVQILNPVLVFIVPFASYLCGELFGFSSIMAIVFCGAFMRPYIRENISRDAFNSIQYFVKVLALASETVIFILLGLSTMSAHHFWDTSFILLTVIFCLIYRTLGVVVMCWVLNKKLLKRFTKVDQFILSFGGLRGAIAYGLVVALPDTLPAKRLFVTCCIVVIYFTVFVQGIALKPIANFLNIEKKIVYERGMLDAVFQKAIDSTMSGLEAIVDQHGHHWLRNTFDQWNDRYLRPLLVKPQAQHSVDRSNLMRLATRLHQKDIGESLEKWRSPTVTPDPPRRDINVDGNVVDVEEIDVPNGDVVQIIKT